MKLSVEQVQHVARLAELAVDDAHAQQLARELEGIVTFVEALGEFDDDVASLTVVGPAQVALREDVVRPIAMVHGPERIAPAFVDGFFVVPKLGGLADE